MQSKMAREGTTRPPILPHKAPGDALIAIQSANSLGKGRLLRTYYCIWSHHLSEVGKGQRKRAEQKARSIGYDKLNQCDLHLLTCLERDQFTRRAY